LLINYLKGVFNQHQQKQQAKALLSILNDGRAIFSSFGNDVYMSDFVNNCIDRIATEVSKINIVSVVQKPGSIRRQNDDITRLFKFKPNPLQTTKDFLANCEWLRRKQNNCFIYPQYIILTDQQGNQYRKYTAFYPLNPVAIEMGLGEDETIWQIKFQWKDGSFDTLPYDDVIHLKWRRGVNTIIGGGDDNARMDTRDLLSSVTALNQVIQGLPLAIESSLKIRGIYTSKSLVGKDGLMKARDEFESHIKTSKTGIVAVDLAGEFTPINMQPADIKPEIMKVLKDIIRERYGISDAIMSGDYSGAQHEAFYQSCLEDFITEFEQAASACIFTQREQDVGHLVRGYYSKTEYLATSDKINLANLATNTGLMTLNQVADMFGYEPFDDGDRRLQSLNFVNTNIIDQYQLKSAEGSSKTPKSNQATQ